MIVDQSAEQAGSVRGSYPLIPSTATGSCQAENGADGYHVPPVHWNYAATTQHRKEVPATRQHPRAMSAGSSANKAAVLLV